MEGQTAFGACEVFHHGMDRHLHGLNGEIDCAYDQYMVSDMFQSIMSKKERGMTDVLDLVCHIGSAKKSAQICFVCCCCPKLQLSTREGE